MTTTTTCHYRKTKSGEWVVCGPTSIVRPGATVTVTKKDGATKVETIERVGREFDGLVYGYIAARENAGHRASNDHRYSRHNCISGGNCSSFGNGRSCGGHDCDGW
jgi:hypothetical protein